MADVPFTLGSRTLPSLSYQLLTSYNCNYQLTTTNQLILLLWLAHWTQRSTILSARTAQKTLFLYCCLRWLPSNGSYIVICVAVVATQRVYMSQYSRRLVSQCQKLSQEKVPLACYYQFYFTRHFQEVFMSIACKYSKIVIQKDLSRDIFVRVD
jgi:hypothetical protein